MKICKRCGEPKEAGRCFKCQKDWHKVYYEKNGDKIRAYTAERRKIHPPDPERSWAYQLKKYGLTVEEYEEKFIRQDGLCACCGQSSNIRLSVDHNHDTGKVRSLLCSPCNLALGCVKENIETLRAMIAYLEEHNG